jgi:molybdopterin-containing oxidoreductase family iron-sulfur binding subunit
MYDAVSASGILDANKASFGVAAIPSYDFSKAEVIVSINCDFLGTWISPVEFSRQFAQTRKLGKEKKSMSRFHAFEARLSMTGANADYRTAIKPSQEGAVVASLYKKLTGSDTFKNDKINKALDRLVKDLKAAQGKALVVSGSNDADVQTVVNAINNELGSYGNTIDMTTPCYLRQGSDAEMDKFIEEAGSTDVVIFYNVNPCYNHPKADKLKSALSKVKTKITFSMRPNETAAMCDYICPNNHYLESWGDAEPKKGQFGLVQPTITPIFKTRQAQESLLVWAEAKTTNFYDFVRGYWSKNIYPAQKQYKTFDEFWANTLHDGVFAGTAVAKPVAEEKKEAKQPDKEAKADEKPTEERPRLAVAGAFKGDVESALADIAKEYKTDSSDLELQVYEKVGIGSGMQANNPWLQEMPDPITRACWGNYVSISQPTAKSKDLSQGDVVKVTANGVSFELPVLVQPGQANDCIVVAIGYGRAVTGKIAQGIGANVFPLVNTKGYHSGVTIAKTGKFEEVAQTQTHHTIMGRDIIQEASLKEYKESASAGRNLITIHTADGPKRPTDISLWKGHTYPNHSWSLMIDLNSCTGCGACVVACQVENNVPVVGKKEVLMRREMHWIRIDRYYSSDANKIASEQDKEGSYGEMEIASDNPDVTFMPLMCQHCNNAPCETVCPVLATTHSNEGLNQMAYNRCVGTRYCANNCPFKVRRFNWFHYAEDDRFTVVNPTQTNDLGRMVLNPDVTVRSRGVMEKCTMCVQRIQAGKLEAKKEKRRPTDGDIQTACSQVCPTGAIIFGDMLNENSEIGKIVAEEHDKRAYHLLEEINVKPQIAYLTKIRNTDEKKARFKAETHGGGHGEHKEGKEHKEHKEEKGKEHKEEKHS